MSDLPGSAIEAEAAGATTVEVAWHGLAVVVPATLEDWPVEAIEHLEEERLTPGLKALLGPAEYAALKARFTELHGRGLVVRDLRALVVATMAVYGLNAPGE